MDQHAIKNKTSREQLRREIEYQINKYLEEGGIIDCLASPNFQANRSARAPDNFTMEH